MDAPALRRRVLVVLAEEPHPDGLGACPIGMAIGLPTGDARRLCLSMHGEGLLSCVQPHSGGQDWRFKITPAGRAALV
jgi:hypothetical protein